MQFAVHKNKLNLYAKIVLRWFETFSSTFQEYILIVHCNLSTSVDAKIVESKKKRKEKKNCLIIDELVAVNYAT